MKGPRPFFRTGRGWYVQLGVKQKKLADGPKNSITEKAALDAFYKLMAASPRLPKSSGGVTLVELIDRYVDWAKSNLSAATVAVNSWRLQQLLDHLARPTMLAKDLRPADLNQWVAMPPKNKDKKSKASSTKRGLIMVVQTAYKWAMENDLIEFSPIALMRKPSNQRRESHVAPDEYAALIAACRHESLRDILTVAWETGMRPQEVRIVEARWIDDGKIVFPVARSKGKKKNRVVYLTEAAAAICRKLSARNPSGTIFRNKYREPWTADALKNAMIRLAKRTGLSRAMVDFRHGFATRKLKDGVGTITLAALMGHADGAMIAKVYSHIHEDEDHLRAALKSSCASPGKPDAPRTTPEPPEPSAPPGSR